MDSPVESLPSRVGQANDCCQSTGAGTATATRRLEASADWIGTREERIVRLKGEFRSLLLQSAATGADGPGLPEINETIQPPSQNVQPMTPAGCLSGRTAETGGPTVGRWLRKQTDRIDACEELIADELEREFEKLLFRSAEITVDGRDLPEIVETIEPQFQAKPGGTRAGDHSAGGCDYPRCDHLDGARHATSGSNGRDEGSLPPDTASGEVDPESAGRVGGKLQPWYLRAPFFIGSQVVAGVALTALFGYFSWRTHGELSVAQVLLWICFLPLFFNNAWMVWHAVYYLFLRKGVVFAEQPLTTFPKTAIIYFVRKESTGLFERLEYTFRNNYLPNADLWIVSGEAPQRYVDYERDVLRRLRAEFGEGCVHWLHSEDPKNKKREMMDIWLNEHAGDYVYFFACDGDSMVPKNALLRLLRKAEHPDNKDIGCFQANTQVASACTYFADNNRKSVAMLMELYLKTKQVVFGEVLSFGHNYLCRCSAMKDLRIPDGVLSHDIWDTVYLRRRGFRTVFCQDVLTYEESPSNYIEERRRNFRWLKGDVESFLLLFEKGVNFEMWFQVYFNLHIYISCFAFFLLFNIATFTELGGIVFGTKTVVALYLLNYGVLTSILAHRIVVARRWNDIKEIYTEIFTSTLVAGNTMLYVIIDIFLVSINRQGWNRWDAMRKDPREGLSWRQSVQGLWPSTVVGLVWTGWLWSHGLFVKMAWSSPILLAFVLSIPTAYFTSKQMPRRQAGSALSIHKGHRQ